jgi:hypothetical protein
MKKLSLLAFIFTIISGLNSYAQMQKDGVVIEACVACANAYGVAEDLRKLGYDVKGMGKPLTDYLKSGAKVLTF